MLLGDRLQRGPAPVQRTALCGPAECGGHPAGELVRFDDPRSQAEGHPDRFGRQPNTVANSSLQNLEHSRIALQLGDVHVVAAFDVHAGHAQIEDRALLHAAFTERREDVADVVEQDLVRSDDEHTFADEPPAMLEQQIGSSVQTNRCLPGSRTTLHDQRLLHGCTDHDVLLGLDRGDDLAHRASSRGTDLGQHRVWNATRRSGRIRVVELLVQIRCQLAIAHHEPTTVAQPEWVECGRPIERRGDRGSPVDDDRIVLDVLDVSTADVPDITVGHCATRGCLGRFVDASEEVAGTRSAQIFQGLLDRDLDVLLGELVGRVLRIDPFEHRDHFVTAGARVGQLSALEIELGKEWRVVHRRDRWSVSRLGTGSGLYARALAVPHRLCETVCVRPSV